MDIKSRATGSKMVFEVGGKLTNQSSSDLIDAVRRMPAHVCDIDIDLSAVDYVSSEGLRALAAAGEFAMSRGGVLRLLSPVASVRETFDLSGLSKVLEIAS